MSVQPFRVAVPEPALADLRDCLRRTRWPDGIDDPGWTRGVPRDVLRDHVSYWAHDFDRRREEARLNEVPQFVTHVDDVPLHFLHVPSSDAAARPLLMVHGWPSSPIEFLRLLPQLGGAFHLVMPSLPGCGFSNPVRRAGWGRLDTIARAVGELMRRLGYDRYDVYGTDIGAGVAAMLAAFEPERVLGTHVTGMVATMPLGPALDVRAFEGRDRERAERFTAYQQDGIGYLHLQSTRPQTIGYALHDSPSGQLAWMLEKYHEWTDPACPLPRDADDRDQLLTNVSVYWFTGSGAASAHAQYEGVRAWRELAAHVGPSDDGTAPLGGTPAAPPSGVGVFRADTGIRAVMDPAPTVRHWAEFDRGGHFPAMEVPELLAADLRRFFDALA